MRPPERDYSHRALIDKFGVKAGQRIAVLGVEDAEFLKDLADRVPEYSRGNPDWECGPDLLLGGSSARGLAIKISLSFDLQVRWHLGCVSEGPKTHPRNRCNQRREIRRAHRQQSLPLLGHPHRPPLCDSSGQTVSTSFQQVSPWVGWVAVRALFQHCYEEYEGEISATSLPQRLIMFLWQ